MFTLAPLGGGTKGLPLWFSQKAPEDLKYWEFHFEICGISSGNNSAQVDC